MTAPELKPCPFCGKMASMSKDSDTDGYGAFYFIKCNSCRAKSPEFYAVEACPIFFTQVRDAWNTRADLHDATKAVEELKFIQTNFTYFIARKPQKMMLPETVQFVLDRINAVLAEIEKGGV